MFPKRAVVFCVVCVTVQHTFGVEGTSCVGRMAFPAVQCAPAFPCAFSDLFNADGAPPRCLVPMGIDQDPYFRLCRDVAPRLGDGFHKPAVIHNGFLPSLQGVSVKMSSTLPATAIFLSDTGKQIKRKIMASFSGGCESKEEALRMGSNLRVDIPFIYLTFFLEDDDRLAAIERNYGSHVKSDGPKMLTSQVKKILVAVVKDIVAKHKQARATITADRFNSFLLHDM